MGKISVFVNKFSVKNFIMLMVAGIVNAVGVTMFLAPVKLFDSGISGLSMLLDAIKEMPEFLTLSVFLIVLNVPLFLYGLKKQGGVFTVYAIFTVVIYSITAFLNNNVLPIDVSASSPFAKTDLLLCAIFGGAISGVGSGLAIRNGGAMDGVEVMSVIFAKKIGISVGSFVMIFNVILYVIAGIVTTSWILPLYSIVAYFINLNVIDFIVDGLDRAKCAMIVTTSPDEICSALMAEFECGATRVEATGGYSKTNKTIVYFVVNRFQVTKMKNIVHSIDAQAYISINEVADVFKANTKKA